MLTFTCPLHHLIVQPSLPIVIRSFCHFLLLLPIPLFLSLFSSTSVLLTVCAENKTSPRAFSVLLQATAKRNEKSSRQTREFCQNVQTDAQWREKGMKGTRYSTEHRVVGGEFDGAYTVDILTDWTRWCVNRSSERVLPHLLILFDKNSPLKSTFYWSPSSSPSVFLLSPPTRHSFVCPRRLYSRRANSTKVGNRDGNSRRRSRAAIIWQTIRWYF